MNLTFTACCCSFLRLTASGVDSDLLVLILGLCTKRHINQDPCDNKSRPFWDKRAENTTSQVMNDGVGAAIKRNPRTVAALAVNSVLGVECLPTSLYDGNTENTFTHCMGIYHVKSEVQKSVALLLRTVTQIAVRGTSATSFSILSFAGGAFGAKIAKAVQVCPIVCDNGMPITLVAVEPIPHPGYGRTCGTEDLGKTVLGTAKVLGLNVMNPADANGCIRILMHRVWSRVGGGSEKTRVKITKSFDVIGLGRLLDHPDDYAVERTYLDVVPPHLQAYDFMEIMKYVLEVRALFSFVYDVVVIVFPGDVLTLSCFVSILFHLCNSTLIFQHEDLVVRRVVWQPWLPKDTMKTTNPIKRRKWVRQPWLPKDTMM
jgi:hypothetical protein